MKKARKIIAIAVASALVVSSMALNATALNTTFNLRQIKGAPTSEYKYSDSWTYTAISTTTQHTCTTLTSGAYALVSNGNGLTTIYRNATSAGGTGTATIGQSYVYTAEMLVPDYDNTYYANGTIKN
ncbi:MAG: hypothetical protein FWG90_07770 [Oscillospiraceae bacterium]|nr:hypothetical protein [Oscillospiraceae bacterium]